MRQPSILVYARLTISTQLIVHTSASIQHAGIHYVINFALLGLALLVCTLLDQRQRHRIAARAYRRRFDDAENHIGSRAMHDNTTDNDHEPMASRSRNCTGLSGDSDSVGQMQRHRRGQERRRSFLPWRLVVFLALQAINSAACCLLFIL